MHDPARTLESLKALRHDRGDRSPFSNHNEFLKWVDRASPLLAFNQALAEEFNNSSSAATTVRTWRPEKYIPAINNAIGAVNRAIILLEHTALPATASTNETQIYAPIQSELKSNQVYPKVTLKWLFEHATWPVYATFLGAVAVAFGAGREVGKFEVQIQSSSLSKPTPTTMTPTNTMKSSNELVKPEIRSHISSSPK